MNKHLLDQWLEHPLSKVFFKNLKESRNNYSNDLLNASSERKKSYLVSLISKINTLDTILDVHTFLEDEELGEQ